MTFQHFLEQKLGFETRSYSGRGMYGKSCLGVTVESLSAMWKIAYLIASQDVDNPGTPQWDSMGREYILYWKGIEYGNLDHSCTCGNNEECPAHSWIGFKP